MSDLSEKINEVLREKNVTFEAFANHLGVQEDQLKESFEKNTLEIRTLEKISKELKIPLYRFFRDPLGNLMDYGKDHPVYATITHDELNYLKLQLQVLQKEINLLKFDIEDKNQLIEELLRTVKTNNLK